METAKQNRTSSLSGANLALGMAAGAIGGLVFGTMMAMSNMLPMVGMLVGSDSAVVGFLVHMVISAFAGAAFILIATRIPKTNTALVVAGALYGVLWWVVGALVLMPILLGMNEMVFQIGETQIFSLMGHVVFGIVTAIAYKLISERLHP